jgi:hypothetical protein
MFLRANQALQKKENELVDSSQMDYEGKFATEIKTLRALCDEETPREERQTLIQSLSQHVFLESEHQVVFESIRALFPRGPISPARLLVHLNNRGFPDTDVEKYFQPAPTERSTRQPAGKNRP